MDSLDGKVAIITGGASGIGQATARSLSRRGARVVIADINAEAAGATAGDIAQAGGDAAGIGCDVAQDSAFEELKAFTMDRFGRVDVIMNNVGVLTRGLPEHLPVAEWERVINVNLLSVVRSNAAFLPLLIGQGHGHIVNTASFAGLFTYSYDRLPYAATKAAIIQVSEGLRLYLAPQGIGVTVLCPGPTRTAIMSTMPPTFGPATRTVGPGPQFALLEAETVGEQVAEAILADTFMLYTHQQVRDTLVARAADWDGFIAAQAGRLAGSGN
jgi:NAD(P)-dependent dehydrogenase (short-subunit alcohol dehydrogenase family)